MPGTSKVGSAFNFSMSWNRPAHDDELRLVGARQALVGVLQRDQGTRPPRRTPNVASDAAVSDWKSTLKIHGKISQLIRVRSVDNPDALVLSPTQAYYARENLKLRLLNARLGLLSRNESAFRSDLIVAEETIPNISIPAPSRPRRFRPC